MVRRTLILVLCLVFCAQTGCTISREIADVAPPAQPRLESLEQNLTYRDPDDGRPDYVFPSR
jgi:hypothetical protein